MRAFFSTNIISKLLTVRTAVMPSFSNYFGTRKILSLAEKEEQRIRDSSDRAALYQDFSTPCFPMKSFFKRDKKIFVHYAEPTPRSKDPHGRLILDEQYTQFHRK
jgi:hypothetical protein